MLWMIEDQEPWPDTPQPGDTCRPTTYWSTPELMDLPVELATDVPARIEEVSIGGRRERLAHLGNGFSTVLPDGIDGSGDVVLSGFLVWDRYLWMSHRTVPAGILRVVARHYVTQRIGGRPPADAEAGWYAAHPEGPKDVRSDLDDMPRERSVVSYALSVKLNLS